MIKNTLTIISLSTLLFIGCADKSKVLPLTQQELPSWFTKTPQSTSSVLYSTGEGVSKKDATTNALNNMASTLSVVIESKFQSSTQADDTNGLKSYTKTVKNNVTATVKKLRISNYKIEKYKKIGFHKHIILVSANKSKIFSSLKDEVDKKINFFQQQETTYKKTNLLKQLTFYKKASKDIKELTYKSIILKVLRPSFNDAYISQAILHFQNRYTQLKTNISFDIYAKKDAKSLKPVIEDSLNSYGLKLSKVSNKYHLTLSIKEKILYTRAYGFTLARTTIVINVTNRHHQTISTKQLNIVGQSTQGKKVAKEAVVQNLKLLIEEKGIESIIEL